MEQRIRNVQPVTGSMGDTSHVREPGADTVTGTLLHLQRGAQHHFPERLHPAVDGKRYRDPQTTSCGPWEACRTMRDRIGQDGGVKDTTRRPEDSTNQGPWGLTEADLPTKDHAVAGPRSPMYLQQVCSLGFMWVHDVSDTVACLWIPSP